MSPGFSGCGLRPNGIGSRKEGNPLFGLDLSLVVLAALITLFAGFVKGAVGFAMPMIMMSAFTAFLSGQTALALLILPTLATNIAQAFRQGPAAARESAWKFRLHIGAVILTLALSAKTFLFIPFRNGSWRASRRAHPWLCALATRRTPPDAAH